MVVETRTQNALDRFISRARELFASEPDLDKRWEALTPILAELLADPTVIEASNAWPDCVAAEGRGENLIFYEDPDFGFAVNGLTKGEARQGRLSRIHDHGHIYTLYGVLDGHERIERYDRLDDRSRPDYAEITLAANKYVGPGEIDLVEGAVRDTPGEHGGRADGRGHHPQQEGGQPPAGPLRRRNRGVLRGLRPAPDARGDVRQHLGEPHPSRVSHSTPGHGRERPMGA